MSTPMYDLPEHCPIPINALGQGPALDGDAVRSVCWCSDQNCMEFYGSRTGETP